MGFQRAGAGEFRQLVAIVMIVRESAELEIVPDAVVTQLRSLLRAQDFPSGGLKTQSWRNRKRSSKLTMPGRTQPEWRESRLPRNER